MEMIPVSEAIGMVLGYDITEIVPGRFKGAAFKKGHIICKNDIPRLLDIGKKHIYVMDLSTDMLHENDAARIMAHAAAGPGIDLTEPSEGKIEFIATHTGLLDRKSTRLNSSHNSESRMPSSA
jgi:hypothetical protein